MSSFAMYAFLALVIIGAIWMYSPESEAGSIGREVKFDLIGPATPATPVSDGTSISINVAEGTETAQLYPQSVNEEIGKCRKCTENKSPLFQQVAIEKGTGITSLLVDSNNNGGNKVIMSHREWIEIVSNDEGLVTRVADIMKGVEEEMIRMFGDREQISGEGMERYPREMRDPRQMEDKYQERRRYAEMMRNPAMVRSRLKEIFFSLFQLNGWFNNVENWIGISRPVEDTNYIANMGMLGTAFNWMHQVCNTGMLFTDPMMRDPTAMCRMVFTDLLRDSYELNTIFNDGQILDFFRIRYPL